MAGLPNYILCGFLLRVVGDPSVGEDGCGNTLSAIVVPGSKLNVGALVRISSVTTPRSALYEQPDVLKLELGELI